MRLPRFLRWFSPKCVCGYRRRCHNADCKHAGYGACPTFKRGVPA